MVEPVGGLSSDGPFCLCLRGKTCIKEKRGNIYKIHNCYLFRKVSEYKVTSMAFATNAGFYVVCVSRQFMEHLWKKTAYVKSYSI